MRLFARVETNGRRRDADLLQLVGNRFRDGLLLAGDAFDRQELHQMLFRRLDVQWNVFAHGTVLFCEIKNRVENCKLRCIANRP